MICISIGNTTIERCLELAGKYPFTEIRLDMIELTLSDMEQITKQGCWVATCRPGRLNSEQRNRLLINAIDKGASYIDIEYESEPDFRDILVKHAKDAGCKVIISYHNFTDTPNKKTLREIIKNSFAMGGDRVKLATMANSYIDTARIMSLYEDFDRLIAFTMGEKGKISRIAAPVFGADFTYASVNEHEATAPGQITAKDLNVIYNTIIPNNNNPM